jgi:hypothetical protein
MKQETLFFNAALLLFIVLAYFMITSVYVNGDVAYLIHAANQLLAGETYGKEIFETNPPLILYLYMPICLLARYTGFNQISIMPFYILLLITLSSSCCFVLLRKIIAKEDNMLLSILSIVLLYTLYLSPVIEWGQREHILLILMLPYLFAAVLVIENEPLSTFSRVCITIFAGLGFALKPFFLITPFLVEMYFFLKTRRIRMEALILSCIFILYLGTVYLLQPGYLYVVLPLVSDLYFIGYAQSLNEFLQNYFVLFCIFTLIIAILFYKQVTYQTFHRVLILATLGMIVSFVIPRSPWYIHVLPALGLSFLLMAFILSRIFLPLPKYQKKRFINLHVIFFAVISLILFAVPLKYHGIFFKDARTTKLGQEKLIAFISTLPQKQSIFCFSPKTICDCFPLVDNTHNRYGSSFPFFWWYNGLRYRESQTSILSNKIAKDKKYLFEKLVADFQQYQPNLLIVNNGSPNNTKAFISYLLQDAKFHGIWQQYQFFKSVDYYKIYIKKHTLQDKADET